MRFLSPLVLLVVIATVVYIATRSARGRSTNRTVASPDAEPGVMVAHDAGRGPRGRHALADDLARWGALGLLSDEQAAAILANEFPLQPTGTTVRGARPAAQPSRVPVFAEALGYLGGILAIVGLGLVLGKYWPDMSFPARAALSAGGAVALLVAGVLVRAGTDPALLRMRSFLWTASTAASALFAASVAADGFDADSPASIAVACSAMVSLQAGLLWWWRDRPLQQLAFLGGVVTLAASIVAEFAKQGPVGLIVSLLGAVYVGAGLRGWTPLRLLTLGVGSLAVIVGPLVTIGGWTGFGSVFMVASALALLALAVVPGVVPHRSEQIVVAAIGGLGLLQAVPVALGHFARDAGTVTGVITWAVGATLLFTGARSLVRWSIVVEVAGALTLIGGAALTGVQWHGFAPLFGIATATALVGLGTLPGQVLLSVFGSLGLLINVPWAIGWFFPGEGRAPLLIMVSGALILAVAVLLARMRGRLRRELGGPRHGPRPSGAVPAM